MAIQNFPIGAIAAETDAGLDNVFVRTDEYRRAASLDDSACFLVGRTGAGKSAILESVEQEFGDDSNYLVVRVNPEATYLDTFLHAPALNSEHDSGVEQIAFKLAWHYVIMTKVLWAKYPEGPNATILRGERLKAYRFLEKANELAKHQKTFMDIFLGMFEEINLSFLTAKKSSEPAHQLLREAERFFESGFWDVVGGAKLFILVDDLDLSWDPSSDAQQRLLRALFEVLKDYNFRERVKPLVSVRDDILASSTFKQREKSADYMLRVEWNAANLEELIKARVREVHSIHPSVIEKDFFSGDVSGESPLAYIMERTLLRPRDAIDFVNLAITRAAAANDKRVFPRHIRSAESEYSDRRLAALCEEWKWVYPKLDVFCEHLMTVWPANSIEDWVEPRELKMVLDDVISADEPGLGWLRANLGVHGAPDPLVEILVGLGVLQTKEPVQPGSFKVTKRSRFRVHPMLHARLFEMSEGTDVWS